MEHKDRIQPVILSGGAGTRLWPLSRALYPKQYQALAGEQGLLEHTLQRVSDSELFAPPLIVCNAEQRFLVGEALRRQNMTARSILLEPVARNTAPAVCVAALKLARENPETMMIVLPSDHFIAERAGFRKAAVQGVAAARRGWLVTFGITPDRAETGYGYIAQAEALADLDGCHRVARFVEKPDRETANTFLADGGYVWNSGMFLFSAACLTGEMERLRPEITKSALAALDGADRDLDFLRLDKGAFAQAPSISIDYAVMEKTDRAAVLPVDIGWSDVGSWERLWQVGQIDADGNAVSGDVIAIDSRDNYLRSDDRLLATLGVEGLVAVSTKDAVLVCPRERAQDIGLIVNRLAAEGREEHQVHTKVYRPWGSYEGIDAGDGFQAKRLIVNPGASLSLQRHRHRAEHWVVVRGTAEVTRDNEIFTLERNESTYIPLGAVHRLHNPDSKPLHVIEVQSGDYLGEDDIERFEDIYGRDLKVS